MKNILNSIIAIFVISIIAMGCTNKESNANENKKNIILIQTKDSKSTSDLLTKSSAIISNRLKDFSNENFDVSIIPEKNQIHVTLYNDWDLKTTEKLLIQKGSLEFYETYNRETLSELLMDNDHLFSLFDNSDYSSAEIGCTSATNIAKINDYLNTLKLGNQCKFVWSQNSEQSYDCLYALKLFSEKGALIIGNDIESVKSNHDKILQKNEVEISLKEFSSELWANAVSRNINKAIAVVLDNNVIFAPIVQSEIKMGISKLQATLRKRKQNILPRLVIMENYL